MKSEIKKSRIANQISEIVKSNKLTPSEFRYVSSLVRKECKLQIPKVAQRLPDFLTPPEIYDLLNKSSNNSFDNLIIEFMIFTGLRTLETAKLQIGHIDWSNNQLKVIEGKGLKDRYVPITSNLLSKIKLFISTRKRGYVFARSDEKKYTRRALRYRISKQISKCNFTKKITTHSLRHTFACLCLARGMRLEDIKLLLGHSNIKTTEIYAKLELGSIKEQYLKIMDMRG